jgi:hypothetical protein
MAVHEPVLGIPWPSTVDGLETHNQGVAGKVKLNIIPGSTLKDFSFLVLTRLASFIFV